MEGMLNAKNKRLKLSCETVNNKNKDGGGRLFFQQQHATNLCRCEEFHLNHRAGEEATASSDTRFVQVRRTNVVSGPR